LAEHHGTKLAIFEEAPVARWTRKMESRRKGMKRRSVHRRGMKRRVVVCGCEGEKEVWK